MVNGRVKLMLAIAIICWILLTLFILFLFWLSRLEVKDKTGMVNDNVEVVAFEYSSFGGMDGSHTSTTLEKVDSQKAKITYYYETVSGETEEKTKEVSVDAINEISNIFVNCGVAKWGKLKKSELMLLDAPTHSISFKTDKKAYRICDYHIVPKKGKTIFTDTIKVLEKYFEE